jgi:hypothetical protein
MKREITSGTEYESQHHTHMKERASLLCDVQDVRFKIQPNTDTRKNTRSHPKTLWNSQKENIKENKPMHNKYSSKTPNIRHEFSHEHLLHLILRVREQSNCKDKPAQLERMSWARHVKRRESDCPIHHGPQMIKVRRYSIPNLSSKNCRGALPTAQNCK